MATTLKIVTVYDEFYQKMDEIKETCNFLPDVSTEEGYDKSKRVSLDVGKVLTALEKSRVEEKKESMDYGRLVDSEAKKIVTTLKSYQEPHKEAYKELDNQNREREEKRKEELEQRVQDIRGLPEAMADSDAEGVKMALESLAMEECLDFYEFTSQALKARNDSKSALVAMFASKLQQEKDAKELDDLRRKQAVQDQKDHDARIAREAREMAEQKAEADKQEALDREQLLKDQAAQAEFDAEKAEKRRIYEAGEAKARADQAVEDARRLEIKRQEDKEAQEQAELKRREADRKHVSTVLRTAKESLMVAVGIDESRAKEIVLAIKNGDIPAIFIRF